jgi:hypothetical protein
MCDLVFEDLAAKSFRQVNMEIRSGNSVDLRVISFPVSKEPGDSALLRHFLWWEAVDVFPNGFNFLSADTSF